MNNFPPKVKKLLVPQDEVAFKKMALITKTIAQLNKRVDLKRITHGDFTDILEGEGSPSFSRSNSGISYQQSSFQKEPKSKTYLKTSSLMIGFQGKCDSLAEKELKKNQAERIENLKKRMNLE